MTASLAPASGIPAAVGSCSAGGLTFGSVINRHCSKSLVSKTRPDVVFANKLEPSVEYQTRSTAPVAKDGSGSSIAEFPTCRQPTPPVCPETWPQTHQGTATRQAGKTAIDTARTVVLRHIDRVYCILSACALPWKGLNLYSFFTLKPIGSLLAKHFWW